jgi:hypothetical protein
MAPSEPTPEREDTETSPDPQESVTEEVTTEVATEEEPTPRPAIDIEEMEATVNPTGEPDPTQGQSPVQQAAVDPGQMRPDRDLGDIGEAWLKHTTGKDVRDPEPERLNSGINDVIRAHYIDTTPPDRTASMWATMRLVGGVMAEHKWKQFTGGLDQVVQSAIDRDSEQPFAWVDWGDPSRQLGAITGDVYVGGVSELYAIPRGIYGGLIHARNWATNMGVLAVDDDVWAAAAGGRGTLGGELVHQLLRGDIGARLQGLMDGDPARIGQEWRTPFQSFFDGGPESGSAGYLVDMWDPDAVGGSPSISTDIIEGISAWVTAVWLTRGAGSALVARAGISSTRMGVILGGSAKELGPHLQGMSWAGRQLMGAGQFTSRFWLPSAWGNTFAWDPRHGGMHTLMFNYWPEWELETEGPMAGLPKLTADRLKIPGRPQWLQDYHDLIRYREPPPNFTDENGRVLSAELLQQQFMFMFEGAALDIAAEGAFRKIVAPVFKHYYRMSKEAAEAGIQGTPGIAGTWFDELVVGPRDMNAPTASPLAGSKGVLASTAFRHSQAAMVVQEMAIQATKVMKFSAYITEIDPTLGRALTTDEALLRIAEEFPQILSRVQHAEMQTVFLAQTMGIPPGEARIIVQLGETMGEGWQERVWLPRTHQSMVPEAELQVLLQAGGLSPKIALGIARQEQAAIALGRALSRGEVSNNKASILEFLRKRKSFQDEWATSKVTVGGKKKDFLAAESPFTKRTRYHWGQENQALRKSTPGKSKGQSSRVLVEGGEERLTLELLEMAEQGKMARHWYKESSDEILRITGGNTDDATALAGLVAITSANNKLDTNWGMALQMYYAWKAGEPFFDAAGVFRFGRNGKMAREAEEFLLFIRSGGKEGSVAKGTKRNNFWVNLMEQINPRLTQGVTVDMHMMRSFGHLTDSPSPLQYAWGEEMMAKVLARYNAKHGTNLTSRELQAQIWTPQKHANDVVFKHQIGVMRGTIAADAAIPEMTSVNFRHLSQQGRARIARNPIPSADSGVLAGLREEATLWTSDLADQYARAVDDIFFDENGVNQLAARTGMLQGDPMTPAMTAGRTTAGTLTEAVQLPKGKLAGKPEGTPQHLSSAAKNNTEAYALGHMWATRSERSAYYVELAKKNAALNNGVDYELSRALSAEQFNAIQRDFTELFGENAGRIHVTYGEAGELRLINFSDEISNQEFRNAAEEILERHARNETTGQGSQFLADGDIVTHNWADDPTGQSILVRLDEAGFSEAARWLEDFAAPRLQAVNEGQAAKGYGNPGQYVDVNGRPIKADPSYGGKGTVLLQRTNEEAMASGPSIKGFAILDKESGHTIVQGITEASDISTAVHEYLGHGFANSALNKALPLAERPLGLTDEVIDHVVFVFSNGRITNGVMDDVAYENFARAFEAYIVRGDFPSTWSPEMVNAVGTLTAGIRDIYGDISRIPGLVDGLSAEMVAVFESLFTRTDLPLMWAPGKYFAKPMTWGSVLNRMGEIESAGGRWMDDEALLDSLAVAVTRTGDDITFNPNVTRRFGDIMANGTESEKRRLFAAIVHASREAESNGLIKSMGSLTHEAGQLEASRLFARLIGTDEGHIMDVVGRLYGMFTPEKSNVAFTHVVNAANILMRFKMERVVKAMRAAKASGSVTDIAILQRELLDSQILAKHVTGFATDWGRTGQALQGNYMPSALPTIDMLLDPEKAARFLDHAGLNPVVNGDELIQLVEEAARGHTRNNGYGPLARAINQSNKHIGSRATPIFMEMYINGLLSAPSTFLGITTMSPLLTTAVEGVQHFVGGMIQGIPEIASLGALKTGGLAQAAESLMNLPRWFRNAKTGLKQLFRTYLHEGSIFIPNHELIDAPRAGMRAISYGEGKPMKSRPPGSFPIGRRRDLGDALGEQGMMVPGEGDNTILWWLVNGAGRTVRIPGNAISSTDEVFRVAGGRTALEAKIYRENMNKALDAAGHADSNTFRRAGAAAGLHRQVAEDTLKQVEKHINNGALRTKDVLFREAMSLPEVQRLKQGTPLEVEEAMEMVQKYVNDNWNGVLDEAGNVVTKGLRENVEYTTDYATRQTFTGPVVSTAGKWFQSGLNALPVLRILVPFFRTPAKIFERFGGYSPTSGLFEVANRTWSLGRGRGFTLNAPNKNGKGSHILAAHRRTMDDLHSGDPRRMAEARGRQAAGVAMVAGFYELAAGGHITGGGPSDPNQRQIWHLTGWRPYSLKVGGVWISYKKGDPAAIAIGVMADTFEVMSGSPGMSQGDMVDLMGSVMISVAEGMSERSYVGGIERAFNAMQDPETRADDFVRETITSMLPFSSAGRNITRAGHPALYEARSIIEEIRTVTFAGLPWGPGNTPFRRNVFGERITMASMGEPDGTAYLNSFNPFRHSYETGDVAMEELKEIEFLGTPPLERQEGVSMVQYLGERQSIVPKEPATRWNPDTQTREILSDEFGNPIENAITGFSRTISVPDPEWLNDEGLQPYDYWLREVSRVKLVSPSGSGKMVSLRKGVEEVIAGKGTIGHAYTAFAIDNEANREQKRIIIGDMVKMARDIAYMRTQKHRNEDGSLAYAAWLHQVKAARIIARPEQDWDLAGPGPAAEAKRRDIRNRGVGTRNSSLMQTILEHAEERP